MGTYCDDFGWAVFDKFEAHEEKITFELLYTDPQGSGFYGHMKVAYCLNFDPSEGFWIGTVTTLDGKHSFKVHAVVTEVGGRFFDPFLKPSHVASK